MQTESSPIDESELPGIPTQKTLALVNTYLVHSTRLLNEFAASAEHRLQTTRSRINYLDAKLQLLEARVDSAYRSCIEPTPALEGSGVPQEAGSPSRPSEVTGPESVAPSVQEGSELDPHDVQELGHAPPPGSPPGSREPGQWPLPGVVKGEAIAVGGGSQTDNSRNTPFRMKSLGKEENA